MTVSRCVNGCGILPTSIGCHVGLWIRKKSECQDKWVCCSFDCVACRVMDVWFLCGSWTRETSTTVTIERLLSCKRVNLERNNSGKDSGIPLDAFGKA